VICTLFIHNNFSSVKGSIDSGMLVLTRTVMGGTKNTGRCSDEKMLFIAEMNICAKVCICKWFLATRLA